MFLKYSVLDEKTNFRDVMRKEAVHTVTRHCAEPSTGVLRTQPTAGNSHSAKLSSAPGLNYDRYFTLTDLGSL